MLSAVKIETLDKSDKENLSKYQLQDTKFLILL